MKAEYNFSKGESTKQYIERKVTTYLSITPRPVSIEEVRNHFLELNNPTISRMSAEGFEKLAGEQILAHSMKHM